MALLRTCNNYAKARTFDPVDRTGSLMNKSLSKDGGRTDVGAMVLLGQLARQHLSSPAVTEKGSTILFQTLTTKG